MPKSNTSPKNTKKKNPKQMAKIEQWIIDRVMEAARIEEVVGDCLGWHPGNRGGLRKIGVRYTAICPFHDDRHDGNFIVYPRGNCYRCFTCDAAGDAVKFLMEYEKLSFPDAIRWLGRKYNIEVDHIDPNYTPPPPRPAPPPLPILSLPMRFVTAKEHLQGDNLMRFIQEGVRWDSVARQRIAQVVQEYHLGHSSFESYGRRHEFTVFWQIDDQQRVRTAHYMKYREDGHRIKEKQEYPTDWFHAMLARPRPMTGKDGFPVRDENGQTVMHQPYLHIYDEERQRVEMCLFGLHLIAKYPEATVNLVESEKTAILMAIAYGNRRQQVWMACCGASNLTRERLDPLIRRNRKIILYPDRDGIEKWREKADSIHYARLSINAEPVMKWWREGDGEKADIADVVIRYINESEPYTSINQVAAQSSAAKKLITNFNLEICNGNEERQV